MSDAALDYPVTLRLTGRRVAVVGGGAVAERKVASLLASGASIILVAPQLSEALAARAARGEIEWRERAYSSGDLADCFLAFACTNDRAVNASVAEEARRSGALTNLADDPEQSDFHVSAAVRRGDLLVAVSTGGSSPLIASLLRRRIDALLSDDLVALTDILRLFRERAPAELHSADDRRALYRAIATEETLSLIASDSPQALLDHLAAIAHAHGMSLPPEVRERITFPR